MDIKTTLTWMIIAAGICQLTIVLASFRLPGVLGWEADLDKMNPLNRQIFKVYSLYILAINLCFALLSLILTGYLIDGTVLAIAVSLFMAVYWGVRMVLQFTYYDTSHKPDGKLYALAEIYFSAVFIFLTVTYAAAVFYNMDCLRPNTN